MAECDSTGRELSFEWSHQTILSTDSKVSLILPNSTKHSGSERVKGLTLYDGVNGISSALIFYQFSWQHLCRKSTKLDSNDTRFTMIYDHVGY